MRYLLPLVFAAILTGCSSDKTTLDTPDGEVIVHQDDEKVTVKTVRDGKTETVEVEDASGEMRMTSSDGSTLVGGTTIPDSFPLKVPGGAAVQGVTHSNSGETGDEMFFVQFTTSGSPAETAADLEQQLKEKGLEVERVEQSADGGSLVILNGQSDKEEAHVQVGTEGGKTAVMITWNRQKS